MKNILKVLKEKVNAGSALLNLITGILTLIGAISNLFANILDSKYTLLLFSFCIFLFLRTVANYARNAKRKVLNVEVPVYKESYRKIANLIYKGSYLVFIPPVYLGISAYIKNINYRRINETQFGLIITSFSKSDDDDFSYRLFNTLYNNLQNIDSINTIRESIFINSGSKGYMDTIKQVFAGNYFNHGLLVFGKRTEASKLFDCSIYMNRQSKANLIYLQNPDLINFSIDYQSEIISDFILGLLYYDIGNYALSKDKLQNALHLNNNNGNKKFMAYCHLYIGNSMFNEKDNRSSMAYYKEGLRLDDTNPFLHYNLAIASLNEKDSLDAFRHFSIADSLYSELGNPLKKFKETLNRRMDVQPNKQSANKEAAEDVKSERSDSLQQQVLVMNNEGNGTMYSVIINNKRYGVLSRNGDTIIKCKYDYIDNYSYNYNGMKLFIVGLNGKFGAINDKGLFEFALKYSSSDDVKGAMNERMKKKKSAIVIQF